MAIENIKKSSFKSGFINSLTEISCYKVRFEIIKNVHIFVNS